ncbi:hypothetical protein KY360_06230 [Candidatus Woesearchaeota archaeon]|nr:hypothetical protein [Candidatus Woesearchaeota archaeon]
MNNFLKQKSDFLKKIDKSKKKSIDKEIIPLIESINKKQNYYTTSSCSGRVVILKKGPQKKKGTKWLYSTHKKADFRELKDSLKTIPKQELWFRQEPLILHICCKTLNDAKKLLNTARTIFKRAGIITMNKKIIIEIIGTELIHTIISRNRKLLVTEAYLKELVKEANNNMKINNNNINKFHKLIRT